MFLVNTFFLNYNSASNKSFFSPLSEIKILGESNTQVWSGIAWMYLGILGYFRVLSDSLGYSWVFLVIAWLLLGHARVWLGYYSGDFLLQITGCPLPHALSHTQKIVTAASKMRGVLNLTQSPWRTNGLTDKQSLR